MTRIPKVPSGTLLGSSLMDLDDVLNFPVKSHKEEVLKPDGSSCYVEKPFDQMKAFPDHKFKLYTGQRLNDMVDSIKAYGILVPIILWHKNDDYIILSGHNRVEAAKLAGLHSGLVIIREDLTYEEAVFIVTETNLRQRSFSDLSPSEKVYSLKQHYDALKKQGKRSDLLREIDEYLRPRNPDNTGGNDTSPENQEKSRTDQKLAEEYGLGKDKIARYVRIATVIPQLLEYLDLKKITFESAYHLSFLKENEQRLIHKMLETEGFVLNTKISSLLHEYSNAGKLTEDIITSILSGEKNRKPKSNNPKPIQIKGTAINKYFSESQSRKEIEETIDKALEFYYANRDDSENALVIE